MNKFKVGDRVKVIDTGCVYSTNTHVINYLTERKIPTDKWEWRYIPEIGQEFQIDYIMDSTDDEIRKMFLTLGYNVAFISNDKKSVIIGVNGLELVSKSNESDSSRELEASSELDTQEKIKEMCDSIKDLLLYKNEMYGDSAINPEKIFYKGDNTTSILVRLNDKISRIKHNKDDPRVNDVADVIGYCILLLISMGVNKNEIDSLKD